MGLGGPDSHWPAICGSCPNP